MDALARLVAIEEIRQLKARYFRAMDMRDWDGMAQVFCKEARLDCTEGFFYTPLGGEPVGSVGPVTVGRDTIIEWISAANAGLTTVHHGHCHEIVIDSDSEAHGIIALADTLRAADRETRLIEAMGHYHERYRVEDGQWRIAETRLTRLFVDALNDNIDGIIAEQSGVKAK